MSFRSCARPALVLPLAGLVLLAGPVGAQEAAEPVAALDSGDTAWMLTSTAIVLMMTIPGLALFYGGMVRKKNVLATVMQSFAACCLISIVWMVAGYSIAFTDGGAAQALTGGLSQLLLAALEKEALVATIPESVFVIFQMTFAIITAALICGAFADRMKFSALLVFLALWSLVVYSPIAHWVWGGGFLFDAGVLDFAGGTVVHLNSGVAALVAALVIGPRAGYPAEPMAPHNLALSVTGAALLWVGWFGFNAGSALAANETAGMAMAVTQIAAAAGGLAWMFVEWAVHKKPSILGIISGSIAGLVAITPASGFVGPGGALVIGLAAGAGSYWAVTSLKRRFGYDDSLDVFGIHGVAGLIGAILTGVFAAEAVGGTPGLLEGNPGQVLIQIWGVAATVLWCAVASFVLLKIVDAAIGLRVGKEAEIEGLDLRLHGEVVP
ncbi:MAG TPA: ammonium transporter [Aestuariivirgaceae bacterium]|nr:ammonium transporter [Aestuariivirgaceae bacterium]